MAEKILGEISRPVYDGERFVGTETFIKARGRGITVEMRLADGGKSLRPLNPVEQGMFRFNWKKKTVTVRGRRGSKT